MRACSKEQMRAADRDATDIAGIPSILLMEHAAQAVAAELPQGSESFAIFCGRGNNAGDGFAIARLLISRGQHADVYLVCGDKFSGDCAVNYEILKRIGTPIIPLTDNSDLGALIASHSVVVDAIYGTGVHGVVEGLAAHVINAINEGGKPVYAVDVPSGMDSNTGEICGVCVNADVTVTFAAYKSGLFLYPAADYAGRVLVRDIGIPDFIFERIGGAQVLDRRSAMRLLPSRADNSHKGTYGKVLVVGGSTGMTGAPCLSARAALASGCGIVTAAVPASLNDIMEVKLTEEMTLPLPDLDGHFSEEAAQRLLQIEQGYDAVVFGPGIGRSNGIGTMLAELTTVVGAPLIIDADGLYALAQNIDMLKNSARSIILTPHAGELERLAGRAVSESEKLEFCKKFAHEHSVTLVLKGHHTTVTAADGRQYINNTGNSGMATAGSGDALAGIIASLAARMENAAEAAALGVYLHGLAGDIAAEKLGENGIRAMSIIDCIPAAMQK